MKSACSAVGANRAHNACKFLLRFKAIETEGKRKTSKEIENEGSQRKEECGEEGANALLQISN